ncbi:calmodulin [Brachionus plicatilis]|uniref:Calmodulin n=1 Tax=Brachionus plicatilis TaxID=10195 RepID=A0A3M7RB75_BRAPC|nr:calmodulin [Brachionus plicatilis]
MADAEKKVQILEQFKKLDKDQSGQLNKEEIKAALKEIYSNIDLHLSDADIENLINSVDKNGDGKINIEEFVQLI